MLPPPSLSLLASAEAGKPGTLCSWPRTQLTEIQSVTMKNGCTHLCMHMWRPRGPSQASFSVVLYFLFLRQGLALNLWLVSLAKPTGQQTPGSACLYSVTPGLELKACNLPGFLDLNEVLLFVQALS